MAINKASLVVSALCLVVVALCLTIPLPHDKVVFLDVGQGDAILIQNQTSQVLIDGGPGMKVLERLGEELPWFDRRIEVVIATHPDQDHLEGLLHVLERYDVDLVLLPFMPHSTQLQKEWLRTVQQVIADKNIEYRFGWRGQRVELPDATVKLVGPFSQEGKIVAKGKQTNNAAILSRVDFHGLSFLLTSDAEEVVEKMLIAQSDPALLDVAVLKAGHHGSKTSTSPELLSASSPHTVVISVGEKNRYNHPHPTVLERLKGYHLLRTDQSGSIRFIHDKIGWSEQCQKTC